MEEDLAWIACKVIDYSIYLVAMHNLVEEPATAAPPQRGPSFCWQAWLCLGERERIYVHNFTNINRIQY
jgi:hypothetical protein